MIILGDGIQIEVVKRFFYIFERENRIIIVQIVFMFLELKVLSNIHLFKAPRIFDKLLAPFFRVQLYQVLRNCVLLTFKFFSAKSLVQVMKYGFMIFTIFFDFYVVRYFKLVAAL